MGDIAKNKIRMSLVIEKELKNKLTDIAAQDKRSLNNLICMVLEDYVNKKNKI